MVEPVEIPESEAEGLFRRQGIGVEEGGKIKIHPLEALYLIESGKLKIENETFESLMGKTKKEDALAGEKYAILKHLRLRGYIVRPSFADEPWMRLYRKGFRPGEDRTQWLLKTVKGEWNPELGEILEDMKKAADVRKELVYAFVRGGNPVFFKVMRTSFD